MTALSDARHPYNWTCHTRRWQAGAAVHQEACQPPQVPRQRCHPERRKQQCLIQSLAVAVRTRFLSFQPYALVYTSTIFVMVDLLHCSCLLAAHAS
jgi:hypothetical protein